ncbi:antitoxin Xre-like helix-turn-helix domain-containing protein [Halofilum ochraceum]|uniref:antitoxin Xre-like helix-turn-helix domain-containing protein n=1 Tax=Halofilum ochraceum TaxID=1611323 RepID=UPI0009F3DE5F|nr:antitoxin Xre-like helix-turn-helix domain-containing protein [Halofilum ochraceum]
MARAAALDQPTRSPTDEDRRAEAGLRTVFNIFDKLRITVDEGRILLGGVSRSTYHRWKKAPGSATVSRDLEERLSYILGIYKALQILVPDERQRRLFLRRENTSPLCHGATPLDVMLRGRVSDLYRVRRWLDGERGW